MDTRPLDVRTVPLCGGVIQGQGQPGGPLEQRPDHAVDDPLLVAGDEGGGGCEGERDVPATLPERERNVIELRFGTGDELVGAAIFLSSAKASSFVTGIDLRVDGGFLSQTI